MMKDICSHDVCTGCSLCAVVCPVGCISMREGRLGHLFPEIDTAACIDCGLCTRSCPSLKPAGSHENGLPVSDDALGAAQGGRIPPGGVDGSGLPSGAYAAWAMDADEYRSSASGGAASVLARHFISEGGVVFGCTSISEGRWRGVRHIRVDSLEDVALLKGSKYIQSSLKDALPLLKKDVSDGRKVLFIGTPCQADAVRSLFRNVPDNLYIVDLICHGVPSEALFRKYLRHYLHIDPDRLTGVNFRPEGGFRMEVYGAGGNGTDRQVDSGKIPGKLLYTHAGLSSMRTENLYYSLFMDGFIYRESCYRCRYACGHRVSDMTIGDFWGLSGSLPEHGVSLVLPVTDKGRGLMPVLQERMYVHERSLHEAMDGNEQLRHPRHKSVRIRVFRRLVSVFGLWVYYPLIADWLVLRRLRKLLGVLERTVKEFLKN